MNELGKREVRKPGLNKMCLICFPQALQAVAFLMLAFSFVVRVLGFRVLVFMLGFRVVVFMLGFRVVVFMLGFRVRGA